MPHPSDQLIAQQIASAWNKGPCVFKGVLERPLFGAEDLFAGLLGTADAMARGLPQPSGRVTLNGRDAATHEVPSFFPGPSTHSFEDYERQLHSIFPDQEYALILNKVDSALPAVRARLEPILHDLFAEVGYPVRGIDSCLYAGNYRSTPFGIHVDDCHVLMASGVGRKSMAFWPRDYFEGRDELFVPGTKAYLHSPATAHLDDAEILEIGPHDLLYWPAGLWHVGISESLDFRASMSVGIYHRGSMNSVLRRALPLPPVVSPNSGLNAFDSLDLDGFEPPSPARPGTGAVPASFLDRWSAMRAALGSSPELAYFRQVLAESTSAGFGELNDREAPDEVPESIHCPKPYALAWIRHEDRIVIGANGCIIDVLGECERWEALLADLKAGVRIRTSVLLRLVPEAAHDDWLNFIARANLAAAD